MAAGGYKEFVAGETLDEDEINDYLMQGMLVFAGTAARGSAIGTPVEGQFSFLADSDSVEFFDGSQWTGLETSTVATGGDHVGTANGFKYHIFLSSDDFVLSSSQAAVECLLIAGGGSGAAGNTAGGGGGAGGLIQKVLSLTAGTYPVVIGDGGAGVSGNTNGNTGNDSTFAGLTAKGGGYGGINGANGGPGGSGGGGGAGPGAGSVGGAAIDEFTAVRYQGIGSQGHSGGGGLAATSEGAGGGGAGSPGHANRGEGEWRADDDTDFGQRNDGGIGKRLDDWGSDASTVAATTIGDKYTYSLDAGGTADAYYFAGGGSGENGTVAGAPGGGGDAGSGTIDGLDGAGGGGGGVNTGTSGAGGSGLLIVRYPV